VPHQQEPAGAGTRSRSCWCLWGLAPAPVSACVAVCATMALYVHCGVGLCVCVCVYGGSGESAVVVVHICCCHCPDVLPVGSTVARTVRGTTPSRANMCNRTATQPTKHWWSKIQHTAHTCPGNGKHTGCCTTNCPHQYTIVNVIGTPDCGFIPLLSHLVRAHAASMIRLR
jgi:hypothetical protein